MSSDQRQNEVDEINQKPELYKRHLQVNSVVHPVRKDNNEWNRKVHSSPLKGYRRFSDQEPSNNENQVNNPLTSCIF